MSARRTIIMSLLQPQPLIHFLLLLLSQQGTHSFADPYFLSLALLPSSRRSLSSISWAQMAKQAQALPLSYSFLSSRVQLAASTRDEMIELEDELDFQPENKHSWIQERIARATRRFVEARTTDLESLSVDICPTKNRDLAVGRMPPLRVRFRRAAIPQLSSSGGSELRLVRVNISPAWVVDKRVRALRRPMEVFGDIRFSEVDVTDSTMVRDLVGHLVNIILTSPLPSWMREGLQVGEIDTIDITTRNRIRVRGRLSNDGFAPPFSVSFGIAVYVTI